MAWLKASAAAATTAHMEVEPPHQRLAGNLDLELPIDMIVFCRSAACGALLGQRHIDDRVGFLFWKGTMGLGAIIVARFAARLFRGVLGRSLGERSGLAFLGTRGVLQQSLQLRHSFLEFGDPPFEPGAVGTSCRCSRITSHNADIGKRAA